MKRRVEPVNSLQKKIYLHMKKRAVALEGIVSKELKKYKRDQENASKRRFRSTTFDELFESINESDFIFLGDFHTFDQNTKNFERIIRHLTKTNKKVTIGIEFVDAKDQIKIDSYLKGYLTELEFLESIDYRESWRFPWTHYKIIFDIALKKKLSVIALNSTGGLRERDEFAAELLSGVKAETPENKVLVLFGEYHIVKDKLPDELSKHLPKRSKMTIIHQNLDEVYWKLNSLTRSTLVRFNKFEYSLQTSPPWVKYESMNYWFDNLNEDPEFDIHQYLIEKRSKTFNGNANENFLFLSKHINDTLDLGLATEELEDFNLYDLTKLEFIENTITNVNRSKLTSFYRKLIKNGKTFKLPFKEKYYCSSYSINRLSFLAGTHTHSLILRKQNLTFEEVLCTGSQKDRYYYFLLQAMVAYFCSKLINPYRKCDLYLDITKRCRSPFTHPSKRENLKLALDFIDGKDVESLVRFKSYRALHSSAKTAGNLLAELFFDLHYKKATKYTGRVLELMYKYMIDDSEYKELLDCILNEANYKKMRKRLF